MSRIVSRRTLARTMAWSLPAVAITTSAPAFAASQCDPALIQNQMRSTALSFNLGNFSPETEAGTTSTHHELTLDSVIILNQETSEAQDAVDGVALAAGTTFILTTTRYLQGVHPELTSDVTSVATPADPRVSVEELGASVEITETGTIPVDGAPDVNGEDGYTTLTFTRRITITDPIMVTEAPLILLSLDVTWFDNADAAWVATEPKVSGENPGYLEPTPTGDGTGACTEYYTSVQSARELRVRE